MQTNDSRQRHGHLPDELGTSQTPKPSNEAAPQYENVTPTVRRRPPPVPPRRPHSRLATSSGSESQESGVEADDLMTISPPSARIPEEIQIYLTLPNGERLEDTDEAEVFFFSVGNRRCATSSTRQLKKGVLISCSPKWSVAETVSVELIRSRGGGMQAGVVIARGKFTFHFPDFNGVARQPLSFPALVLVRRSRYAVGQNFVDDMGSALSGGYYTQHRVYGSNLYVFFEDDKKGIKQYVKAVKENFPLCELDDDPSVGELHAHFPNLVRFSDELESTMPKPAVPTISAYATSNLLYSHSEISAEETETPAMENNDAYEPVEVVKPKEKVGPKSSVDSYGTPFPSQRSCKPMPRKPRPLHRNSSLMSDADPQSDSRLSRFSTTSTSCRSNASVESITAESKSRTLPLKSANDSGISSNSERRYSSNDKAEPFLKKELLPASLAGSSDSGIGVISDLDMKRNTSHDDSNSESEVMKKSSNKFFRKMQVRKVKKT